MDIIKNIDKINLIMNLRSMGIHCPKILSAIEGVSEVQAEQIIALRSQLGRISNIESLRSIEISEQSLDALRKELRDKGILFKITKNRITKLAIKETPKKDLEKYFIGPTAAAISSDPISTAKILTKFFTNSQTEKT